MIAADLNGDSRPEILAAGGQTDVLSVLQGETTARQSFDCDEDGVPDSCQRSAPCVPGDMDSDGDVDLSDLIHFQACFGRSAPYAAPCSSADLDGDDDVDLADYIAWLGFFAGALVP